MTTVLELLKHSNAVTAKHRNLAHGPKALSAPKLSAQQQYTTNHFSTDLRDPSHFHSLFWIKGSLYSIYANTLHNGRWLPDGKFNPPHADDTHSVCRGEGEEASQLSWPQSETLRGGRGSLHPWPPLDPTHRQRWCHKLKQLQRGFFLGGPPPGWTNHTAKVTDPNVSCRQYTTNTTTRPETQCPVLLAGLPKQETEAEVGSPEHQSWQSGFLREVVGAS